MILSPDDLRILTGYKRRAEQKKELEHLQIPYKLRRDGSLLVVWGDVKVNSSAPEPEPEMWA